MFNRGNIIGWKEEDGRISFAVFIITDKNEKSEFTGRVIMTDGRVYELGEYAEDWYAGSYAASTNWVQMKLEVA